MNRKIAESLVDAYSEAVEASVKANDEDATLTGICDNLREVLIEQIAYEPPQLLTYDPTPKVMPCAWDHGPVTATYTNADSLDGVMS